VTSSLKRFYLQPDGQELFPQGGERGHYAISQAVLGAMGITITDREDAYAQMWKLGYVRIVDHGTRVFAELYGNSLSAEQIAYLDCLVRSGKQVFFNDHLFPLEIPPAS